MYFCFASHFVFQGRLSLCIFMYLRVFPSSSFLFCFQLYILRQTGSLHLSVVLRIPKSVLVCFPLSVFECETACICFSFAYTVACLRISYSSRLDSLIQFRDETSTHLYTLTAGSAECRFSWLLGKDSCAVLKM